MLKSDYGRWLSYSKAAGDDLAAMRLQVAGFAYRPLVSLLLLVSDADEVWIKNTINSVLKQIYPRLQLCVCDNGSVRSHVPEVLEEYATAEERVGVRRLPERGSRAEAYDAALSMATGEFVVLLDQGDELLPDALFKVVEFLQRVRADVVYTDEDHVDVAGERMDPVFKPPWSPDLLLCAPYVGRACAVRRSVLEAAGGFREGFEGAEEHDLLLRISEKTDRAYHLPGVLYHRWVPPGRPEPDGAGDEVRLRAVEEALARRGEAATVEPVPAGGLRVRRHPSGRPGVSVILSVTEGADDAPFVEELERETSYPVRQVIVASTEGVTEGGVEPTADRVSHPSPARAMNLAAEKADGEYLLFARGDAREPGPGWLPELLGQAQRPGIGAVGCKLLNPGGGLRHGGSLVDLSRLVGRGGGPAQDGSTLLISDHPFDFGASSAECMMVGRSVFEGAGGFDDENLPTAFYDLDLSFRLREKGLRNVYTPYASLVCEGPGKGSPGESEVAYMWRRWWGELVRLLYYRHPPALRAAHRGKLDEEALLAAISS